MSCKLLKQKKCCFILFFSNMLQCLVRFHTTRIRLFDFIKIHHTKNIYWTVCKTRKEIMRKNCYNLFKNHFLILPYLDTTSILLVGLDSQVASVHWYFLERFLELSYHLFSKSKGKILDDFAFLLRLGILWLLSL